jgi:predicted phosphate transport protein (TIGR00153 family)
VSSLFEWFKSRNEESAINKTFVHMQKVLECVVEFEKGLTFLIEEKNIDLALKVFFRVDELEHQADEIRRNILNMLSMAELTSTIRENLIHLAKRIDDIANAANAGARILIYMDHSKFLKLENEILQKVLELTRKSVETVKKLNVMVNSLITAEEKEIHRLGDEINSLEHQCDEIHFSINRMLLSNHPDINPFTAIEIHDCFLLIETISDNAEDVADYIIMLTVAKRT